MACGFGTARTVARTSRIAARRNLPGKGDAWKAGVVSLCFSPLCFWWLWGAGGWVWGGDSGRGRSQRAGLGGSASSLLRAGAGCGLWAGWGPAGRAPHVHRHTYPYCQTT